MRAFDFHGQVRVRASSGSCTPVEPSKPKLPPAAQAEQLCEQGDASGCVAAGAAIEAKNKMSALSFYLKGCDQSRPTDKIERARSAARSCSEAARVCDVLGYRSRAAALLEKRDAIQHRSGE